MRLRVAVTTPRMKTIGIGVRCLPQSLRKALVPGGAMNEVTFRAVVLALLSVTVLTMVANAQLITFDGCRDIRGIPVASVMDHNVRDVAVAGLAPNGAPIIRYNPTVLSWFHPTTRLWWYGHECGHHALGHNFGTTHPLRVEQDADCFGIRSLINAGLLNDGDIAVIQQDLSRLGPGDWTHLPGPVRAINLRRCVRASQPTPPPPVPRQVYCCDGFGRRWCPVVVNPGPPGSPCWCAGVPGSGVICP